MTTREAQTTPPCPQDLRAVVPSYETAQLTLQCARQLIDSGLPEAQIVVVDDCSRDETVELLTRHFPSIDLLIREKRGGFSRAANHGIEHCLAKGATHVLLTNSDCLVDEPFFEMIRGLIQLDRQDVLWSASLVYPDRRPQWSGSDRFPSSLWLMVNASGVRRLGPTETARSAAESMEKGGSADPLTGTSKVAWAPATCWLIHRSVWSRCGPFSCEYQHYCQDLEFCWRARQAGIEVHSTSRSVVHLHGASTSTHDLRPDRQHDLLWPDLIRWSHRCRGPFRARAAQLSLLAGGLFGCGVDLLGGACRSLFPSTGQPTEWWRVRYHSRLKAVRSLFGTPWRSADPQNPTDCP